MKKHTSTSQLLNFRERPSISVVMIPSLDSSKLAKKCKLTEKLEPSTFPINTRIKEPLSSSIVLNSPTPLIQKNKSSEGYAKGAKQNNPHINKKIFQNTVGLDRKKSVKSQLENREKNLRMNRVSSRKQLQTHKLVASTNHQQSMYCYERHSIHPSTNPVTITQSIRSEGNPSCQQTGIEIYLSSMKQKEQQIRLTVLDIVNNMFESNQFKFRQLSVENKQLKDELLKVKNCLETVEKDRLQSLNSIKSLLSIREDQLQSLKAITQTNQCIIAELEYKLSDTQLQLQSKNSSEISQLQSLVQHLQTQLADQRSKREIAERQSETYKRQLITIKKENVVLRKENTHYRNVNEQNQTNLNEYQTTIMQLRGIIERSSRMTQSLQQQIKEFQKQREVPENELVASLKDLVANSSSQIFRLNREVQNLQIKLGIIQRRHMEQIDRVKTLYNKELRTWKERNKKLVKSNANLKLLVDERNDMSIDFSLNDEVS